MQISGKTLLPVLGVGAVLFIGVALFIDQDLGDAARANRTRMSVDGGVGVEMMSETERAAYVKDNLRIERFSVGPQPKPDSEEVVPGVLKVEGTLINEGDRVVHKVTVMVTTKNEANEVRSTFQESVVERRALQPKESRPFKFRIPDRPEYKAFDYQLR